MLKVGRCCRGLHIHLRMTLYIHEDGTVVVINHVFNLHCKPMFSHDLVRSQTMWCI